MYISNFKGEVFTFSHEHTEALKESISCYPTGSEGFTLLFFPKGGVSLRASSGSEKLSGSDVLLIPNNVYARLAVSEDEKCEYFCVTFSRLLFEQFKDFVPADNEIKRIRCFNTKELMAIFEKIEFYLVSLGEEEFSNVFQTFFKELLYFLKIQETPLVSLYDKGYPPIFIDVLYYVNEHLFTMKNVTEISSAVYISYPYLIKLFKKYLKTTPKKYITEQRLIAAHKLILKGERPVAVYEKCGFETYRMFYRCYVSYFGNAPSKEASNAKIDEVI